MENLPLTFTVYPDIISENRRECLVLLSTSVDGGVAIQLQITGKVQQCVGFERRDDRALLVKIPDIYFCQEKIMLYLYYNGHLIGGKTLQNERPCEMLAQIMERAVNPVEMMLSAIGLKHEADPDLHALDDDLASVASSVMPPANLSSLFREFKNITNTSDNYKRRCKFPTALHFAAFYSFEKLLSVLLECDASKTCLNIRNCDGHTPSDIATNKGFSGINKLIEDALVYESVDDLNLLERIGSEDLNDSPYMEMGLGRHSTPSPHVMNRSRSAGSSLGYIEESPEETRVRSASLHNPSKSNVDKDSGIFIGNRDSTLSQESSHSGGSLYDATSGFEDAQPMRFKVSRSKPVNIKATHTRERRPSLPNVFRELPPTPPSCPGPTYQNTTKTPPPVAPRKTSLPCALDISELTKNQLFRKHKTTVEHDESYP